MLLPIIFLFFLLLPTISLLILSFLATYATLLLKELATQAKRKKGEASIDFTQVGLGMKKLAETFL